MKEFILSVFALTATVSLAFADYGSAPAIAPVATPAAAPVEAKATLANTDATPVVAAEETLAGVVQSVSLADKTKGTKSEIVVANEAGETTTILVKSTTTLYDADAKAITLDGIAAEAQVNVVYTTTAEGVNEAKSVKIIKQ